MILLNSIGNHLRGHTFLPLPYLVWHLLPVIRRFPPNLHSYLATKCLCKWPVSEGFHCIGDLIIIHPGNKIQSNITMLECLTDSVSGKNVEVITNKAEYDIVKTLCDNMILKKNGDVRFMSRDLLTYYRWPPCLHLWNGFWDIMFF